MADENMDLHFYQFVVSMHGAAMMQMGKFANPMSGKIERDLEQAKNSIDLLDMLHRKTEGNLTKEEKQNLDRVLYELRMNYVDEAKKGDTPTETPESSDTAGEQSEKTDDNKDTE